MKPLLRVFILSTLGLSSMMAAAQTVPRLVNYQGKLVTASNTPLATADYPISFSIYNVQAGGSPIWGPQVFDGFANTGHGPLIPVVEGHFNVILGPTDTSGRSVLTAFTSGQYAYLEITISNNLTILPRQQILSAPYALKAADSEMLGGYSWNSFFTGSPASGTINGSRITGGTVGSSQITDYSILASDLAINSVTSDKIANGSVTSAKIADGTISSTDLATSSVTSEKILNGTITSNDLGSSSVNSDKIANGTITTSDLASTVSAALVPVGAIMPFGSPNAPSGWLACYGQTVSRTSYANLFNVIGTRWGSGDGTTTFNLPDLRGMFLRGYNSGRSDSFADPDRYSRVASGTGGSAFNSVGSAQGHQFDSHTHTETRYLDSGKVSSRATPTGDDVGSLETANTGPAGGSETRPNNVYVQFIIKY